VSEVRIHETLLRGIGSNVKNGVSACDGHVYCTAFDSRNSTEVEGALLHDARAILARHTCIS
jgi:hypothetical protein